MKKIENIFFVFICLVNTTISAQDYFTTSPKEFYTKDEIIEPITLVWSRGDTAVMELLEEDQITTIDNKEFLVTLHGSDFSVTSDPFIAAVYLKTDGKYKEIYNSYPSDLNYCTLPHYFKMKPINSIELVEFIHYTEVFYGTGHFVEEYIYQILPTGELKQVLFTPASISYRKYMNEGEGNWKGVMSTFSDEELSFKFLIWNDGDANCCPTAGEVTGTYILKEIEHEKYDYEIIMDSFSRKDYFGKEQ